MSHALSRTALLACVLGVAFAIPAQGPQTATANHAEVIRLRYASFDPIAGEPSVPEPLRNNADHRLWIVQFRGTPTQQGRDAIVESGGEVKGYLPDNAYVVRMSAAAAAAVGVLPQVRWVGSYHAAYRLDPALLAALQDGDLQAARYNLVVVDKHNDKPALGGKIRALGGDVVHEQPGSLLFTVALTPAQLVQVARLDEVLWIDLWTAPELDMDNARIQGGGNYVEAQGGYTGTGVNVHIYEGIEATHPDFTGGALNVLSGGGPDTHGHATAGIVFGNGNSNPAVRGMAPDASKFYTNYSSVSTSRYQVVDTLVNVHQISHTTASWGGARTFFYTSVSADTDDIIFDHGIAWTQSQSNAGNQDSRPEAWAKNVISIGGVRHGDNANPLDDTWNGSGSTGPAQDGRIKPDLAAYYDYIGTSDLTGSAGYSTGNWSSSFGGTSGATPICAGHNVLAIQMFTDETGHPGFGPFGNPLRVANGTVFQNRPNFTTLKALQIVSARQYAFTSTSTDNRREHVGWGFPNLQTMWDNRAKTLIVDETDVLQQGEASRWDITVGVGEAALKVCMTHADPAANPAAAKQLINNLSLRVVSPSGAVYWGNHGLEDGNWSLVGGVEDDTNSLECVFVQNPQAGVWHVDVKATAIVMDAHVQTPGVDADYALVVSGGTGQPGIPPVLATFATFGQGCPGSVPAPSFCAQLNGTGGSLANNTRTWEYCYTVPSIGAAQVIGFDLFTQSTGGTVVLPAHLYASVNGQPGTTPIASTTISVGPTAGFYTATFAAPAAVNGTFYISMDSSAQTARLSQLAAGASGTSYYRAPVTGTWAQSGLVTRPAWRITCAGGSSFKTPVLGNQGLPTLGTTYQVDLGDAIATTPALLLTGLSDTVYNGQPLPYALPNAAGCAILVSPDTTRLAVTTTTGAATLPLAVPNAAAFIGFELLHQWAVLDPANALGIVVSNAGRASIGN